MLLTSEHFGVTVRDIDRSIPFYEGLLGHAPFYRATEGRPYLGQVVGYPGCRIRLAFFHLPGSAAFLELLQYEQPSGEPIDPETFRPGVAHLCFIADDLDLEFERLAPLGATFRHPRPVDRADGGRAIYLRDPDGITVELQERPHA